MDIPYIININSYFSNLNFLNPDLGLELEVYSCKQTKFQKKHLNKKKPLRYYITALEESFLEYDFSNEQSSSFTRTTFEFIKNEMIYYFFTIFKNHEEVDDVIRQIEYILNYCIKIKKTEFFLTEKLIYNETERYKVFILYNKIYKRVILIKFKFKK